MTMENNSNEKTNGLIVHIVRLRRLLVLFLFEGIAIFTYSLQDKIKLWNQGYWPVVLGAGGAVLAVKKM